MACNICNAENSILQITNSIDIKIFTDSVKLCIPNINFGEEIKLALCVSCYDSLMAFNRFRQLCTKHEQYMTQIFKIIKKEKPTSYTQVYEVDSEASEGSEEDVAVIPVKAMTEIENPKKTKMSKTEKKKVKSKTKTEKESKKRKNRDTDTTNLSKKQKKKSTDVTTGTKTKLTKSERKIERKILRQLKKKPKTIKCKNCVKMFTTYKAMMEHVWAVHQRSVTIDVSSVNVWENAETVAGNMNSSNGCVYNNADLGNGESSDVHECEFPVQTVKTEFVENDECMANI